jgi:hypothetical protein
MPGRRHFIAMLIGTLTVLVAVVAASAVASTTSGSSPLVWTKAVNPVRTDADAPGLEAVSCPVNGFCAAIDDDSDVLTSSAPSSGASSWRITTFQGGEDYLSAIDCPASALCLVGDGSGNIWHSSDPGGGYRQWHSVHLEHPINTDGFSGIACPTTTMCAVSDDNGNVWTTTDPVGGKSAWHHAVVPYERDDYVNEPIQCSSTRFCWIEIELSGNREQLWKTTNPLHGDWTKASGSAPAPAATPTVSCPSSGFCVQVGNSGEVSTGPANSGPWTSGQINGWSPLTAVDCLTAFNCIAADSAGNLLHTAPDTAVDQATSVTWTAGHVPGQYFLNGLSCVSQSLCLAGAKGAVMVSHQPMGPATSWSETEIPALKGATVTSISCPSTKLCTATTARGSVLATTDPGGPGSDWKLEKQLSTLSTYGGNEAQYLTFINCPRVHLCFAGTPYSTYLEGTTAGVLLSSNDPTKPSSWHGVRLGFNGISCPTTRLCVAMRLPQASAGGDTIAYSSDPTAGKQAWKLEAFRRLTVPYSIGPSASISCANAHLCVAAGSDNAHHGIGAVAVSTDPTKADSWKVQDLAGSQLVGVSCSQSGQCVAWAENGAIYFATLR